jgi:hypothetical protein
MKVVIDDVRGRSSSLVTGSIVNNEDLPIMEFGFSPHGHEFKVSTSCNLAVTSGCIFMDMIISHGSTADTGYYAMKWIVNTLLENAVPKELVLCQEVLFSGTPADTPLVYSEIADDYFLLETEDGRIIFSLSNNEVRAYHPYTKDSVSLWFEEDEACIFFNTLAKQAKEKIIQK